MNRPRGAVSAGSFTFIFWLLVCHAIEAHAQTAPAIESLSPSATLVAGTPHSFEVIASGDAPLAFQWHVDGTPIAGADAAALDFKPVTENDAGAYTVTVTNAAGTTGSIPILLDVTPATAPRISGWNIPRSGLLGEPWTATVTSGGSQPLEFEWFLDDQSVQRGAENTYSIDAFSADDGGNYSVMVRNYAGQDTLVPISVEVLTPQPPTIVVQPADQLVGFGSTVGPEFTYAGTEPLVFELYRGAELIQRANHHAHLRVGRIDLESAGSYHVRVSSKWGEATSDTFEISISPGDPPRADISAPFVQIQRGQYSSLSLKNISGGSPRSFQWFKDGVPIPDATNSQLSFDKVDDLGSYYATVKNLAGTYTTDPAATAITRAVVPRITSARAEQTSVLTGQVFEGVSVNVSAVGSHPLRYSWSFNGEPIPDQTGSDLFLAPLTPEREGEYTVVVSNSAGSSSPHTTRVEVADQRNEPAVITRHPANGRASADGTIHLSVFRSGGGDVQWFREGVKIPGQNSYSFFVRNPRSSYSGYFHAEVTKGTSKVLSESAYIEVRDPLPPEIYLHPDHGSVLPGQTHRLFAGLRYHTNYYANTTFQWFKDGVAIEGATGSSYRVPGQTGAHGAYTVEATLDADTTTSNPAFVTVDSIASQPFFTQTSGDRVIPENDWLQLTVKTRSSPISIRWERNGEPYAPGDNRTSISLSDSDGPAANGIYRAIATTNEGEFVSREIRVTREYDGAAPVITQNPGRTLTQPGVWIGLSVRAIGERPLSYQWRRNGIDIPGATDPNFNQAPQLSGEDVFGEFSVIVSNHIGSVESLAATVEMEPLPLPLITHHPEHLVVFGTAQYSTLSVRVPDSAYCSYQWYRNGELVSGAKQEGLTPSAHGFEDISGDYHVVVSNSSGSATSVTSRVVHYPDFEPPVVPEFTTHPSDQSLVAGDPLMLQAAASGQNNLVYQWRKNGIPIEGATSSKLEFVTLGSDDSGLYSVIAADEQGLTSSLPATVIVSLPEMPRILNYAVPTRPAMLGESVTFNATAIAASDLQYQWRKNGVAIPGANHSSLTLSGVSAADAGIYTLHLVSDAGARASRSFPLRIVPDAGEAVGRQQLARFGPDSANRFTLSNQIMIGDGTESISWETLLPAGWSLDSTQDNASTRPSRGETDLLTWSWESPTTSSLNFSYVLQAPAEIPDSVALSSLLTVSTTESSREFLIQPDPLLLEPSPSRHTADADNDARLSLSELLRVIELYNTRSGTTRTGRYRPNVDTLDGFETDHQTPSEVATELNTFHSADTDQNGHLGLSELLRIIELYNTREGTTRTGAYRKATDTIDGFAPGAGGE